SQLNYLKWLGISWEEGPDIGGPHGPYHQLKRLDLYQKYAQDLLDKGLAYKDFKEGSKKFAIRFKVPQDVTYTFDDVIRGKLTFESKEIEDWIIMKDNGIPTYNFAVVVDDHHMEITHVCRGEEHITNTPKQIMVYNAFGWEIPTFGHMTIIVNERRKKLSKRDKDVVQFIGEYDQLGYLPEAMLNFLSLLGWTPASDKEILSREELISLFDEHKLSAAPSYFDRAKLAFINSRYIKQLTMDQLKALCRPFLEKAHIEIKSEEWLEQLLGLLRDRLSYGAQIVEYYHAFFHEELTFSEEVINELNQFEQKELVIQEFLNAIENIDFNDSSVIEQTIKEVGQKTLIKGKALFMPIRIATTGEAHGPSLPISLSLLGKDKVIARIKQTLKMIKGV